MHRYMSLFCSVLCAMALVAGCADDAEETTPEVTVETEPAPDSTPATDPAPETNMDLGGQQVVIAVENAYLPFNYIPADGGPASGWDYDAWNAICDIANCKPVFSQRPWPGVFELVAQGMVHTSGNGITITPERQRMVAFSEPYMRIDQRLLVRQDEDRFDDVDDLAADSNLVIGAQPETTNHATAVQAVGEARVVDFRSFGDLTNALQNGVVDAIIVDERAGQGYFGVGADQLKLVGEPLASDRLGFPFAEDSELVPVIDAALAQLKADGTLEKLADRYFSAEFDVTYDKIEMPGES